MKEEAYLIIGRNGVRSVRKSKPSLNWDEITIKIKLDVPDLLFRRPHIEASIKVEEGVLNPIEIKPEILIHTKKLLEQQSGMKVDLRIVPPRDEVRNVRT